MKLAVVLIAIATLPARADEIRIGVLGLFRPQSLTVRASSVEVGGERAGGTVELRAAGNLVICRIGGREMSGQRLNAIGPVTLTVPGRIKRDYAGALEVRAKDGILIPVVRLDLEAAVAVVTTSEMPLGSIEARRAQAVAARSYYKAGPRHADFDFCDTTHCQLLENATTDVAADSTRGRVVTFLGRPIAAMYFRSCGGRTLTAADVKLPGTGYPYFRVDCETCARKPQTWEAKIPAMEIERSEAARLELARKFGWNKIASNDYTIERSGAEMILRGKGHGHGVGLCQRGAEGMAQSGHDYIDILKHYFPNTNVLK